jgi:ABC-type multidrug transport system fused ATPase/permease subunit
MVTPKNNGSTISSRFSLSLSTASRSVAGTPSLHGNPSRWPPYTPSGASGGGANGSSGGAGGGGGGWEPPSPSATSPPRRLQSAFAAASMLRGSLGGSGEDFAGRATASTSRSTLLDGSATELTAVGAAAVAAAEIAAAPAAGDAPRPVSDAVSMLGEAATAPVHPPPLLVLPPSAQGPQDAAATRAVNAPPIDLEGHKRTLSGHLIDMYGTVQEERRRAEAAMAAADAGRPAPGDAIVVTGLNKAYVHVFRGRGSNALSELSLVIEEGECFGLLGPNGAGKTTTIGILSGFVAPSAGRCRIVGRDTATDMRSIYRTMVSCRGSYRSRLACGCRQLPPTAALKATYVHRMLL